LPEIDFSGIIGALYLQKGDCMFRRHITVGFGTLLLGFATQVFAGWTTPVSIATPSGSVVSFGQITLATSSTGAQAAAWVAFNSTNAVAIQAATRNPGGTWTTAQTVGLPTGTNSPLPRVAVAPSGAAVVVWQTRPAANSVAVFAAARPANGNWGAATQLAAATSTSYIVATPYPKVVMDSQGTALATWIQGTQLTASLKAASLAPGGSWGAAFTIGGTPFLTIAADSLAINSSGQALAVWAEGGSNGSSLWTIKGADRRSGVWSAPVTIISQGNRVSLGSIALDDQGDAVVWRHVRGGIATVAERMGSDSWSVTTGPACTDGFGLALDDSGRAASLVQILVWVGASQVDQLGTCTNTVGSSTWTPTLLAGSIASFNASGMVTTPAGTDVAAWIDTKANQLMFSQRAIGATTFSAPAAIGPGSSPGSLAAAMGNVVAMWIGTDGSLEVSELNVP
jgi:hypothetical protein